MTLNFLVDLTLPKVESYHVNQNKIIKKLEVTYLTFELLPVKANLKNVFSSHTVVMATHFVRKMITTCSSLIKSGYNDPSKSKSRKVLETVVSRLSFITTGSSILQTD